MDIDPVVFLEVIFGLIMLLGIGAMLAAKEHCDRAREHRDFARHVELIRHAVGEPKQEPPQEQVNSDASTA